ncbi:hypothetical protein [Kribbella sp. CA-293567]|uniref:hypothetical protein n=1 Tax=Kribbella sp. CA-293567 TaxID=3002436 RepID=UPI0022DCF148|nr:hypothetical protein [Kribbella sp. CA-293567]WBQ06908.1 hypothetical protein OX958_08940 [Kribbella sp. CA-293567]
MTPIRKTPRRRPRRQSALPAHVLAFRGFIFLAVSGLAVTLVLLLQGQTPAVIGGLVIAVATAGAAAATKLTSSRGERPEPGSPRQVSDSWAQMTPTIPVAPGPMTAWLIAVLDRIARIAMLAAVLVRAGVSEGTTTLPPAAQPTALPPPRDPENDDAAA